MRYYPICRNGSTPKYLDCIIGLNKANINNLLVIGILGGIPINIGISYSSLESLVSHVWIVTLLISSRLDSFVVPPAHSSTFPTRQRTARRPTFQKSDHSVPPNIHKWHRNSLPLFPVPPGHSFPNGPIEDCTRNSCKRSSHNQTEPVWPIPQVGATRVEYYIPPCESYRADSAG